MECRGIEHDQGRDLQRLKNIYSSGSNQNCYEGMKYMVAALIEVRVKVGPKP